MNRKQRREVTDKIKKERFKEEEIYDLTKRLKVGHSYTLSKRTPLMPIFDPAKRADDEIPEGLNFHQKVLNMPVNQSIKIHKLKYKRGTPWFLAEIGEHKICGWVNGIALIGQTLFKKK